MKTLVVANQKGGVGKSMLVVHLAHYAARRNQRVLVIDLDGQGNTTQCLPADGEGLAARALFRPKLTAVPAPVQGAEKIWIVGASRELDDVEAMPLEIVHLPAARLASLAPSFDFCVIDTPPSLGRRLLAGLVASNFVVSPFMLHSFALTGISDLLRTIDMVKTNGWNPNLVNIGILANKVNTRSAQQEATWKLLKAEMGKYLLPKWIAERAAVADSLEEGRAVWTKRRGQSQQSAALEVMEACAMIYKKVMA